MECREALNLLNKIFVGEKRDGTYEIHRSVYSPRSNKYKNMIQVEFENIFDKAMRTFTCRVKSGFVTDINLWNFINKWADTNILIKPQNILLGGEVYYIKDPENVVAGSSSVVVVAGDGTLIADGSFQIVAYNNIKVCKMTDARVDSWDNVTVSVNPIGALGEMNNNQSKQVEHAKLMQTFTVNLAEYCENQGIKLGTDVVVSELHDSVEILCDPNLPAIHHNTLIKMLAELTEAIKTTI